MNTIVSQHDLKQKIDTLPWELSELIYEHYHKIKMNANLLKIQTLSLEIQEVWTFMNKIYKFCAIDFINHHINKYIIKNEPYYNVLCDKKFNSQMILLLETLQNGYELYKSYCENQLNILFNYIEFTPISLPLFPGIFLEAFITMNDLIKWTPLYTKYKDTVYLKHLKDNAYKSHVLLSVPDIKEAIIEMYF